MTGLEEQLHHLAMFEAGANCMIPCLTVEV